MLNNEDKKLHGVIFQAAGIVHPEAEILWNKTSCHETKKISYSRGGKWNKMNTYQLVLLSCWGPDSALMASGLT